MKIKRGQKIFSPIILFFIVCCSLSFQLYAQTRNNSIVTQQANPFPLSSVTLLPGPFYNAMINDKKWLLDLQSDRLLSGFRSEAGLQPKAPKYGGWESQGVAGQTLGHYLSACAFIYAATKDTAILNRINYVISELGICQQANGNGYVAAIPNGKQVFAIIAAGNIQSKGFDLNGLWVPWYNLHKLCAGLIDVYENTGSQQAKNILINLCNWAIDINKNLSYEQMQTVLRCEYGGINESFAKVYGLTGEKKYLELAQRFNHDAIFNPLRHQQDSLAGLHANTQLPKVIGLANQYLFTGNTNDIAAARFFWHQVVQHHSYANGGNSESEYFGAPNAIASRLTGKTTETCNSYNMLKLTHQLFNLNPEVSYADYYENTLYNHILGSQNPETGMVTYFTPLAPGYKKSFSSPFDSFWCCVGSGLENHAKYGEFIYSKNTKGDLYINLFIPSALNYDEKGIKIALTTNFPEDNKIKVSVVSAPQQNSSSTIYLRYPQWATQGAKLNINGKPYTIKNKPGSYIKISRVWRKGDELDYQLNMPIRLEATPGDSTLKAIYYGPILLSANLGSQFNAKTDSLKVLVGNIPDANQQIKRVNGNQLAMKTSGLGRPSDFLLTPFYKEYKNAYQVYFNNYNTAEWSKKEAYFYNAEKRKALENANTVDELNLGEMQPERDHNLQGEETITGAAKGVKYRLAKAGGWFSVDLNVLHNVPQKLKITYLGGVSNESGFDILINDVFLTSESVHWFEGDTFEKSYAIDSKIIQNKKKITIKFKAKPNKIAGEVVALKLVKTND